MLSVIPTKVGASADGTSIQRGRGAGHHHSPSFQSFTSQFNAPPLWIPASAGMTLWRGSFAMVHKAEGWNHSPSFQSLKSQFKIPNTNR